MPEGSGCMTQQITPGPGQISPPRQASSAAARLSLSRPAAFAPLLTGTTLPKKATGRRSSTPPEQKRHALSRMAQEQTWGEQ